MGAPQRCRLVLMAGSAVADQAIESALAGGDVASVILTPLATDGRLDESAFAERARRLVPMVQSCGAAAIVAFETRAAARAGADGVHLEGGVQQVAEDVARLSGETALGIGNVSDRHGALAVGELPIDYVFFGRLHRDIRPEPHARNLELARWWASMVEIPCILSGGNSLDALAEAAETGTDFVALGSAIFDANDPGEAVARANAILDEHAPPFE